MKKNAYSCYPSFCPFLLKRRTHSERATNICTILVQIFNMKAGQFAQDMPQTLAVAPFWSMP
tara:strand:- start:26396 stop:26581 length:186 start_codon:yes stop_codon:yes gene_type:complete